MKLPILSIVSGEIIDLTELDDSRFSEKSLGEGYAVIPYHNEIVSPVSGRISVVFKPKHALAVQANEGPEWLIHIGVDPERMDIQSIISILVIEGQNVQKGEIIAKIHVKSFMEDQINQMIPVFLTSMDRVTNFNIEKFGLVDTLENIGNFEYF